MILSIVVASGSGLRFKSKNDCSFPKQYFKLNNEPIISISVRSILRNRFIKAAVILIREDDFQLASEIFSREIEDKKVFLTYGGRDRLDSSINGLRYIEKNFLNHPDLVIIHDAVRPIIKQDLIDTLISTISNNKNYDSVLPVLKISEALKRIENNIISSVDRNLYFTAQTPQIFRFEKIIDCVNKFYNPDSDNSVSHDEVDFLQKNGYSVGYVDGYKENIKITTESDILFAEYLMKNIMK